jgi:hypothetical protein
VSPRCGSAAACTTAPRQFWCIAFRSQLRLVPRNLTLPNLLVPAKRPFQIKMLGSSQRLGAAQRLPLSCVSNHLNTCLWCAGRHAACQSSFSGARVARLAQPRSGVRAARVMPVVECKRVAVLGAAGGIGQPLSLLMKMNKCTTELALYDIANVKGVVADLSHCNTPVKVSWCAVWCARQAAAKLPAANHPQQCTNVAPQGFTSHFCKRLHFSLGSMEQKQDSSSVCCSICFRPGAAASQGPHHHSPAVCCWWRADCQ